MSKDEDISSLSLTYLSKHTHFLPKTSPGQHIIKSDIDVTIKVARDLVCVRDVKVFSMTMNIACKKMNKNSFCYFQTVYSMYMPID